MHERWKASIKECSQGTKKRAGEGRVRIVTKRRQKVESIEQNLKEYSRVCLDQGKDTLGEEISEAGGGEGRPRG